MFKLDKFKLQTIMNAKTDSKAIQVCCAPPKKRDNLASVKQINQALEIENLRLF